MVVTRSVCFPMVLKRTIWTFGWGKDDRFTCQWYFMPVILRPSAPGRQQSFKKINKHDRNILEDIIFIIFFSVNCIIYTTNNQFVKSWILPIVKNNWKTTRTDTNVLILLLDVTLDSDINTVPNLFISTGQMFVGFQCPTDTKWIQSWRDKILTTRKSWCIRGFRSLFFVIYGREPGSRRKKKRVSSVLTYFWMLEVGR